MLHNEDGRGERVPLDVCFPLTEAADNAPGPPVVVFSRRPRLTMFCKASVMLHVSNDFPVEVDILIVC